MEKLQANLIIEILGRPADNVKEALNTIVMRLGTEQGVKILDKKYHDPVEIKDVPDLFTAFAEVNVELDTILNYLGIIFAYMPSNIELISPEKISMSNQDINQLANVLAQRLHNYDALTKSVIFERNAIARKLEELSPKALKEVVESIRPKQPEQEPLKSLESTVETPEKIKKEKSKKEKKSKKK